MKKKSEVRNQKSEKKGYSDKKKQTTKDTKKSDPTGSGGPLEVVFERVALLNALKLCGYAAAKSSPKPILENVLITAADDGASIRATDLEVALEVKVPCRAKGTGTVLLPAKELTEAVDRSDDDEVTLRAGDKCIELVTGDGRYQFNIINLKPFPDKMFGFSVENSCELKPADLKKAIGRVTCAVGKETTRYAMNGLWWESSTTGISLVATDGRRLAKTTLKTEAGGHQSEEKRIISRRTAILLAHLEADDTVCRIEFSDSNVFLTTDKIYIAGLLLIGKFPKYSDIIPAGCEHSIELDAAAVIKQVYRAKIFEGDEDNERNITISSENGEILFDSFNLEVGSAEMRLALTDPSPQGSAAASEEKNGKGKSEGSGGPFEISVRSKYLLDALKTMDKFRLEVNDSDKPLVLADDTTTHVIMPVSV